MWEIKIQEKKFGNS